MCFMSSSLCVPKLQGDQGMHIRVDPDPGIVTLKNDLILVAHGSCLIIGKAKKPNKNPIAERAIVKLGVEYLRISSDGGPTTPVNLALATSNINSQTWSDGLTARKVWTQRDQITCRQLPIEYRQIIAK